MKIQHLLIGVIVAGTLALGGCASTPDRIDSLEQARSQVNALSADPLASKAASRQLEAARENLESADRALEKGERRDRIEHLAYLAMRNAQVGLAATAEARAQEQIAKTQAERNRVLLEGREREAVVATAQARAAQADAQQAQAQAQQSQAQAQQAMDAARSEAAQAEAARQELARMQQAMAELQAKQTERGMVLTLGDVLFDTGQSTLKPGADLTIERLARFLSENPDTRIVIEGHTDSVGTAEYNEALSERRAQAVASALRTRDIDSGRFEVRGRGEAYPVAGNETNAGRQQNRRVEIVFSDLKGHFVQSGEGPANR